MADISITAANVIAGSNASTASGTAGVAITAGQVVALDNSTTPATVKLADVNSASAWQRTPVGIALNGAAAGQPVVYQTGGDITIGGTLVAGAAYFASGTAGGVRPQADNTTGDYPALLGLATSTSVLRIGLLAPGVAI
jgi:hypothetical protein